jgi:hypothetical protein
MTAALLAAVLFFPSSAVAQNAPRASRTFAGGLFGVSTLSADGAASTTSAGAALSMYAPENGAALNLFAGIHLYEYFSLQANWMWNQNDLALFAASTLDGSFYEQRRRSQQHTAVLDGLIYFRRRDSAVRPYLGTGLAVVRFSSEASHSATSHGILPPAAAIGSTGIALRSHVGIDVRLTRRLSFRYSFSETIGGNPISPALTPPARRRLANFQNLFGFVRRF